MGCSGSKDLASNPEKRHAANQREPLRKSSGGALPLSSSRSPSAANQPKGNPDLTLLKELPSQPMDSKRRKTKRARPSPGALASVASNLDKKIKACCSLPLMARDTSPKASSEMGLQRILLSSPPEGPHGPPDGLDVTSIPRPMPRSTYSPKIDELKALAKSILFPQPTGDIVQQTNGMTVRKIMRRGSDGVEMPMCCVSLLLPEFPAHAVYNFLRDKAGSINWHKDVATVTEKTQDLGAAAMLADDVGDGPPGSGGDSLRLWLTQYKIPAFARFCGLPPREVLEYRACIASEPEAYFIIGSSTGTEALGLPASPGHTRAHLNIGAYAFISLPQGGTEMRTVAHMNPTGVPAWILDMIATRKPREFCECVVKELHK